VLDSLVPVLLVGDMVLSGAVVEAEGVDLVASFTVVVGVGAKVVDSGPASLELGAIEVLWLIRTFHYNKIIACLVELSSQVHTRSTLLSS
jgi:hypothetical protein